MKHFFKIIVLLIFIGLISCHQQQKKVIAQAKITTKITQSDTFETSKKTDKDKIIGNYYVNDFYTYLKSGFVLKNEKPRDDYGVYKFNFKENGEIIFKDLTKFYSCGNGILRIKKGTWQISDGGIYTLTFDGSYALDYKFHTESEYTFKKLKNGNIYLKLRKVIANEKNQNWD